MLYSQIKGSTGIEILHSAAHSSSRLHVFLFRGVGVRQYLSALSLPSIRKEIQASKGKGNLPSAYFFLFTLETEFFLWGHFFFLCLALSATTDKLLNHSNRGMADIFPGVSEKKIRELVCYLYYQRMTSCFPGGTEGVTHFTKQNH